MNNNRTLLHKHQEYGPCDHCSHSLTDLKPIIVYVYNNGDIEALCKECIDN